MTDETLTQSELDEIIDKLKRAIKRGDIQMVSHDRATVTTATGITIGAHNLFRVDEYRIRRKPIAGWVNVYDRPPFHSTKKEADEKAASSRIACVYVEETEAPGDDESP